MGFGSRVNTGRGRQEEGRGATCTADRSMKPESSDYSADEGNLFRFARCLVGSSETDRLLICFNIG